jgi:hypothetical protein
MKPDTELSNRKREEHLSKDGKWQMAFFPKSAASAAIRQQR